MTEYWVSQGKHWCKYCKCWLQDDPITKRIHENGKGHKENVQKFLVQQQVDKLAEKRDRAKFEAAWREMNQHAEASMRKDGLAEEPAGSAGAAMVPPKPPELPADNDLPRDWLGREWMLNPPPPPPRRPPQARADAADELAAADPASRRAQAAASAMTKDLFVEGDAEATEVKQREQLARIGGVQVDDDGHVYVSGPPAASLLQPGMWCEALMEAGTAGVKQEFPPRWRAGVVRGPGAQVGELAVDLVDHASGGQGAVKSEPGVLASDGGHPAAAGDGGVGGGGGSGGLLAAGASLDGGWSESLSLPQARVRAYAGNVKTTQKALAEVIPEMVRLAKLAGLAARHRTREAAAGAGAQKAGSAAPATAGPAEEEAGSRFRSWADEGRDEDAFGSTVAVAGILDGKYRGVDLTARAASKAKVEGEAEVEEPEEAAVFLKRKVAGKKRKKKRGRARLMME